MSLRDRDVFLAELSEAAGRYEEMMEAMKRLAKMDVEFNEKECRLLSVAFKSYLKPFRSSLTTFDATERRERQNGRLEEIKILKSFREKIEFKIKNNCFALLALVENHLLPNSKKPQNKVFFTKFMADYYRYIAELEKGQEYSNARERAGVTYVQAMKLAEKYLPPGHPVSITTALNYSLFLNEFLNSPEQAVKLSQAAFDKAMACKEPMTHSQEDEVKNSLKLLRDNIAAWRAELELKQQRERVQESEPDSQRLSTREGDDGAGEQEDDGGNLKENDENFEIGEVHDNREDDDDDEGNQEDDLEDHDTEDNDDHEDDEEEGNDNDKENDGKGDNRDGGKEGDGTQDEYTDNNEENDEDLDDIDENYEINQDEIPESQDEDYDYEDEDYDEEKDLSEDDDEEEDEKMQKRCEDKLEHLGAGDLSDGENFCVLEDYCEEDN